MISNLSPKLNLLTTIVKKAGSFITEAHNNLQSLKITQKADKSFVSNVDVGVENYIVTAIKKAGFDDYFITEETGSFGNENSRFTWIIDPIDGTNNFIHGLPHCCISIALKKDNEIVLGLIYNPFLDMMFTAEKGKGAMLNNRRIRVSTKENFTATLISCSLKYSTSLFKESYYEEILKLNKVISGYRYSGSIAMDLAYLAAGFIDGLWTTSSVKIWDVAAGFIIAKEAGAIITDINGLSNMEKADFIIAGNRKLQPKISKMLAKHVRT